MAFIIQDGTGKANSGKIGTDFRFWVDSLQKTTAENASISGDAYNVNTGSINLTSANKSAVFYLKNTGVNDLVFDSFFYLIGNSTGGSGDMIITILRNPTTGTIVSNAVAPDINVNKNFGSFNTITGDAYKGAEGYTFTNGDKYIESIFNQGSTRAVVGLGYTTLPKGSSIGVEITPATGNTSVNIEVAASLFERRLT